MNIVFVDGATACYGDEIDFTVFGKLGQFTLYHNMSSEADILRVCEQADVILVNKAIFTASIINQFSPTVKLIVVTATGYNNIDVNAALKREITVCNVPNYGTNAVASLAMLFIISCATQFTAHLTKLRTNGWQVGSAFTFPMHELAGKTLGIVGYGAIGKQVGKLSAAFGMRIVAYARHPADDAHVEFMSLFDLAKQADFVSVSLALNSATKAIVNAEFLAQMKLTAFLINTARGGLIDEDALITALRNKQIAGAALDVLVDEPPRSDHPLLQMNNVIITPHIAWAPVETRQRCIDIAAQNIASFIAGTPINLVT